VVRLASNRIAWTYTDDKGVDYRVAAQKALTDQNKLGGSAAAATVMPKPGWLKMRRVTVSDGTYSRTVPAYTPLAPILAAGEVINVNAQDDSRLLSSNGSMIGEKRPPDGRITKESA
jgi:hypothetical protein